MPSLQIGFLAFTVLAPICLIALSRRLAPSGFDTTVCRILAGILLITEMAETTMKLTVEHLPIGSALPMQLCDWALLCTAAALLWRNQRVFELAYYWGLAGTTQGLLTPAIDPAIPAWRVAAFYLIHSGIVIGVVFLAGALRLRPSRSSLVWIFGCSEGYLALALIINASTGQNYGFLAHPPITPSLLDAFSKQHGLYILEINAVALLAFLLLYLPWWIADRRRPAIAN